MLGLKQAWGNYSLASRYLGALAWELVNSIAIAVGYGTTGALTYGMVILADN